MATSYNTNSTTADFGNQNQAVADLQTYLNSKGANLSVDSKYGPLTQAAVAKYGMPAPKPQPAQATTTNNTAVQNIPLMQANMSPASSTPTVPTTSPNAPLSTGNMNNILNGSDPVAMVNANKGMQSLSDKAGQIATTTFSGTKQSIADLKQSLQDNIASQKAAAQANVDALQGELVKDIGTTQNQDTLASVFDEFDVKRKIETLSDIQQKIIDAQEALNMGLIYEKNRPAKMQLLVGREASLQRQGLATIGTLQATASIIKGNIDLARAYADQTVEALNADLDRSSSALKTLLAMENEKLVTLTSDEKKLLTDRINDIEAQQKGLGSNKNSVLKLIENNAYAANKGGVLITDSYETALEKMRPYLSQIEQQKIFDSNDMDVLNGYLADVDTFEDQATALADLEANRNTIIAEVGADGYQQIVDAINAKFAGGAQGASATGGSGNYGKGPYATIDAVTRAKQLFNQGLKTPGAIKRSLIGNGYSQAAASAAANEYYSTDFDKVIGNIGDFLFNE